MNIPDLPFLDKKKKSEYFLSLVLRDEKVNAVVFEEIQGKGNVIGHHEVAFRTSIEDCTQEELIDVIDKAVSTAEKTLPQGEESNKTIFGVKTDWIEDGKIKKDYLAKLKKVSDDLEFTPVGFLVIPEAIAHLLQKEEGAPVSGIIAEVGEKHVNVSLIKAGKFLESKSSAIHENTPFTVDTLLKHFTTSEILPSRIILYDGGSEKLQQEFISHSWSKSLPFLHLPQITNLPKNFDARAVLTGAATQMGFEILESPLLKAPHEEIKTLDLIDDEKAPQVEEDKTLGELVASDFGFVEGKDVSEKTKKEEPVSDNIKKPTIEDQFREIPEEVKLKTTQRKELPVVATMLFAKLKLGLPKIIATLKSFALKGASAPRKLLILGILPLLLLILIFYVYFFARSATVTLSVNSRETQREEDVTFAESETSDPSINLIRAQFVKVSQDGKITKPTTGKKETGDKAKGVVTIFNNSDSTVTIASGTTIVSSNDRKFTTDREVKVEPAAGDVFTGTEPGKQNVPVTAETFGTEYNLPSNTKFTVEGASSSIAAKNDEAFKGGTKKEIKVVSENDLEKLQEDLQKQLEEQARAEIAKRIDGDSELLPALTDVTFERRSFSKEEEDEANEVSLTATISYEGVSYKKSDIADFARNKLIEGVGGGLTINEENVSLEVKDIEKKINDEVAAKLEVKASLVPDIKEGDLSKDISGKSIDDAIRRLSSIPEVKEVEVDLSLAPPLLPKRLPFRGDKIKIVVEKNG